MLFENNDYDFDVLNLAGFNFPEPNSYYYGFDNQSQLVDVNEGFLRGNMWKNEYVPYKGMPHGRLKPTCEQEALLFHIIALDFAINDLNLYLDLHPEDQKIYETFKTYTKECIELKDRYAKEFGPLSLDQTMSSKYEWMKNPWPWDKSGGSMYV